MDESSGVRRVLVRVVRMVLRAALALYRPKSVLSSEGRCVQTATRTFLLFADAGDSTHFHGVNRAVVRDP